MTKTDVLIIGGGPAGVIAAVTAKKNNPTKKVILVREKQVGVIPCGIPYVFHRLKSVEEDIMPDKSLVANKISLVIDKALIINTLKKTVILASEGQIRYDKLIIATGSEPIKVPIKGIDKKGVWQIKKNIKYLKKLRRAVLRAKKIVIIGGGYIGVELAEELSNIKGKKVSIIEKLDYCLETTMDKELAIEAEKKLKEHGVNIYTDTTVRKIGDEKVVRYVKLGNGKRIPADLVIISIGARPNVEIIKKTHIKKGQYGGIKVDQYMRTSVPGIFAVGDCAETKEFFTGKSIPIMLASTACYEARIAGTNVYRKKKLIKNRGTLACFSTSLYGLTLGSVGLNKKTATQKIVVGTSECPCHHPGTLPHTQPVRVKLIFSKPRGLLLGGQVMGPESVGETINILALAIQQGITAYELSTLQIATHPLLTPAPTVYPLIIAAQSVLAQL